jgi:hypothetical protein
MQLLSGTLRTYPSSRGGIQLVFCAEIIELVLCHVAVITADMFQYSLFCPQYRFWGSTIIQLLDAPANGTL